MSLWENFLGLLGAITTEWHRSAEAGADAREREKKTTKAKTKRGSRTSVLYSAAFWCFSTFARSRFAPRCGNNSAVFLFYRDEDRLGYPLVVCLLLCDFFCYFFVVNPFRVKLCFGQLVLWWSDEKVFQATSSQWSIPKVHDLIKKRVYRLTLHVFKQRLWPKVHVLMC